MDSGGGSVLVRVPIGGADSMDLRIWPEHQVLAAVTAHLDHAPRLLFASAAPAYQIQRFVEGELLADLAPRGVRVPRFVQDDVVALFAALFGRLGFPASPLDDVVRGLEGMASRPFGLVHADVHRRT